MYDKEREATQFRSLLADKYPVPRLTLGLTLVSFRITLGTKRVVWLPGARKLPYELKSVLHRSR